MIPGPALAQWLVDEPAQRCSYRRVDAAMHKWSASPLMTQLERDIGALEPRTPDTLLDLARRFMDRTGDIESMMGDFIAECRAEPFFRPPFHPMTNEVQNSLLLYHHRDLWISLGVTSVDMLAAKKAGRKGPGSINFTGFVTLLRFVKSGGATLSFWEAPAITDRFLAGSAGNCRMVGRRRIGDGEEVVVDGRHQSFVIEHASDDILFFQAVTRADCAPVGAEYDSDTLRFVAASSTDDASSRSQMMVSLLRAMERDDAFPIFEELLRSPLFYTRWHVMREMLAMDAEASLPALRRMAAGDPHPDVRAAAAQTLRLFFEDEAPPAGEGVACLA
jgi:hypothetical protein